MWRLSDILDIKNILGSNVDRSQVIRIQYATADPTIYLSCTGGINIVSIKSGKVIRDYRTDLNLINVSVQSDANTPFAIYGNVTELIADNDCLFDLSQNDSLEYLTSRVNSLLTSLDLSNRQNLIVATIADCYNLTSVNTSGCLNLKALILNNCTSLVTLIPSVNIEELQLENTAIQDLNLSNLQILNNLSIAGMTSLQSLYIKSLILTSILIDGSETNIENINCRAMHLGVANDIATLINNATSTTGDLYIRPSDPYSGTITSAAYNKGWTVHTF